VIDFDASRDHVHEVRANGQSIAVDFSNGHIVVPAASLSVGANSVHVTFTAGDPPLNRHHDFLYTLFVPARARQAIPCFDQPDLKGRWTLHLELPAQWQSVANGAETERAQAGDRVRVRFAETPPLPTYLVAFVAGEFKVETGVRNGRTMRFLHRETDAEKVARNVGTIFDLHSTALDVAERYTAIPYPFDKLDFVAIPALPFGAMEHAGAIVYTAAELLLDASASQAALLNRAHVIAHEVAHAWFGNLVTMRWFDDVWTKEVFANFVAAKIVTPSFPAMNHDLRFFLDHYPGAYAEDRSAGAGPVRQSLANLADAGSLYTDIIYLKAPVAMRHLESLLGEGSLRDGLREYLRAHAYGNATWADLIRVLSPRAPVDLASWSAVWIDAPGRPTVTTELQAEKGRIARLAFVQQDERRRGLVWSQRLKVAMGPVERPAMIDVLLTGPSTEVEVARGHAVPAIVLPSAGGWGYGDFVLDRATAERLLRALPRMNDPLTRGSAWVTLWDAVVGNRLAPGRFFDLGLLAVAVESDEQLAGVMLADLQQAWWRFLTPQQRTTRARHLEAALRRGLAAAPTVTRKAPWFRALYQTATTAATTQWLREVWAGRVTIPGLPLAESDLTRLALELAVREPAGWRDILDTQAGRIANADRKAQFEFVRPVVSADAAERARWFAALRNVASRRQERWVSEGLAYLHHPLRARGSLQFIRPGLDLLEEVHATSNLGFPTSWAYATLSGHNSRAAADLVDAFLDSRPPEYPKHLRDATLMASDLLFRSARITNPAGPPASGAPGR
jgi:aminopeptidase N